MAYFISPPEATSWHFTQEQLVRSLSAAWIPADAAGPIQVANDGVRAGRVVATLVGHDGEFEVAQNRAHPFQSLDVDGQLGDTYRFAAWWRGEVDAAQPLTLYDESLTTIVELVEGMTAYDIVERADGLGNQR